MDKEYLIIEFDESVGDLSIQLIKKILQESMGYKVNIDRINDINIEFERCDVCKKILFKNFNQDYYIESINKVFCEHHYVEYTNKNEVRE